MARQRDERYGYKHWTLEDPPRCFNVGKGLKGRANSSKSRNHKWHGIVKRYGLRIEVCIGFKCKNYTCTHERAEKCHADENVCLWEIENIALMGTYSTNHSHDDPNDIGCNFSHGGERGTGDKSIEKRRKNSEAAKLQWKRMYSVMKDATRESGIKRRGRKRSPEYTLKIVTANTGKKRSPQAIENLRAGALRRPPVSELSRLKRRLARLGKAPANKGKKTGKPAWNAGKKTPENVRQKLRQIAGYKRFRKQSHAWFKDSMTNTVDTPHETG
jgi:hypothetical protein